jgi:hypothetical protein
MKIEHRIKTISECNPDFLAVGKGGFTGYFVYGFKSKKIFILESIHYSLSSGGTIQNVHLGLLSS